MKYICVSLTVLFLVFFSASQAQDIALDTAVHTGKLANGFTYFIRYNNEPKNRVDLYLVNKVGSVLEDSDQQGLAHFMEHMNFNGTSHFPKNELVSYLQKSGVRFGADLNAYTSFDETVFQLPLPADDPSILKNGFQIMRDWAQNATLDSTEISKERGVVLEEQRLGRGASERMERVYFPVLLNQSRYAERLPIGTVDILKNFPPAAIRRFHHDWYRPDLQALVVVGDIDVAKTEALVKQLFSDLKAPDNERVRIRYEAPLTGHNQFIAVTDAEMPQTVMQVFIKHKEEKLITEANYIHSMQRQLFNQIMGERIATLSQTPNLPFVQAGVSIDGFIGSLDAFSTEILLKQGKYKEGFESVWREVERVRRFGFTQTELDRAKQNYLSQMETAVKEKDKTNSESFVGEYQRNFLNQEASPGISWEHDFVKNNIAGISLEQINGLTKNYIRDTDRDILILAPDKDKLLLPDSAMVNAWIRDIAGENLSAFSDEVSSQTLIAGTLKPGKVIAVKKMESVGVTEWTLSNGARVVLKPTDFKNDEIRFEAFAPGGSSVYPDASYQNARNAAIIAGFGVGKINPIQLDKMMAGKILEVNPYITDRRQGIEGSAAPKDLETALQLMYLRFTSPRRDTALFDNTLNSAREMIANRASDPDNRFSDTVTLVLGNYNYRRTPPSLQKLNQLSLDKLYQIYRERFADAANFTFVFVGNFQIDSIRPLLEKYIGSLPATHKNEMARDLGIHVPAGKMTKKVYGGKEDKATVKIVYSGDYIYNPLNNLTLQALKEVLSIKIIQHLREDESEVYAPSVQVTMNKYPRNRYAFTIGFGCAPANTDHLIDAVAKELAVLRANGPSLEDLNKFKAEYKRVQELQQTQNPYWITSLVNQYENHEKPSPVSDSYKLLDSLTTSSLKKAAGLYLSGVNAIRFELLPEKK